MRRRATTAVATALMLLLQLSPSLADETKRTCEPLLHTKEPEPGDPNYNQKKKAFDEALAICWRGYPEDMRPYLGKPCKRIKRAAPAPDPDQPTPAVETPSGQTTEKQVFEVCGGLGCVDDPDSTDEAGGKCWFPETPSDCAGVDVVAGGAGGAPTRCGEQHIPPDPIKGIVPKRFILTLNAIVDSGIDGAKGFNPDLVGGILFQLGLGRSKARKMADGGLLHYGFPNFFFHVELFLSKLRAGHDVGFGYKTGNRYLTRLALTAWGQYAGENDLNDGNATYRIGPAAQLEIFHSLIVKGGYLMGTGDGPVWFFGLTFGARLIDDFKI